jgi:hypothetical protein
MGKTGLFLSLISLVALGACATHEATPAPGAVIVPSGGTVSSSGATVVSPGSTVAVTPAAPTVVVPTTVALRPGSGRIESISAVPGALSSSAGASRSNAMQRVGVKMDDGTAQFVDTDAPDLAVGDRVTLTRDGYIRHPAQ